MTVQEKTSEQHSRRQRTKLWLHGAVALSILALSSLATSPLSGVVRYPEHWLVALFSCSALGLLGGLVYCLMSTRSDLRAYGVAVGASGIYLAAQLDGWALSSPGRFTAALTESLSLSLFGLPWVAMLMAFSVLALVLIQLEHLKLALSSAPGRLSRFLLALTTVVSGLLWLRALTGYASGSPNLFP